jgi:siroheme synthase
MLARGSLLTTRALNMLLTAAVQAGDAATEERLFKLAEEHNVDVSCCCMWVCGWVPRLCVCGCAATEERLFKLAAEHNVDVSCCCMWVVWCVPRLWVGGCVGGWVGP